MLSVRKTVGQDRTSNTFRHVFVSCLTVTFKNTYVLVVDIPPEVKNPDVKDDILINIS